MRAVMEKTTLLDRRLYHQQIIKSNSWWSHWEKRYIFIYLPDSLDTGIFAFHETSRLNARTPIKSTVELGFKAHNPSLEARILPLLHKDIPQTIKDSPVIEIKAIGYKTSKDTADAMRLIGDRMTADFVIKTKVIQWAISMIISENLLHKIS